MPISGIEAELRREAKALGIRIRYRTAVEEVRDRDGGVEFYLALISARSAADPSRRIAVVPGRGRRAAGAVLLVGESLRKSTPLSGKAAQVALSDGIDAGDTIARLIEAEGDPAGEASTGPRRRSLRRIDQLRRAVRERVRRVKQARPLARVRRARAR